MKNQPGECQLTEGFQSEGEIRNTPSFYRWFRATMPFLSYIIAEYYYKMEVVKIDEVEL